MSQFVENPTDFSAECRRQNGRCKVARENVLFLDDGTELAAVDRLQWRCGYIVIVPDVSRVDRATLYHTSCQRMSDAVSQIFSDCLEKPESLPQSASEMSLGELYRRGVTISFDECRSRVDRFDFQDFPED